MGTKHTKDWKIVYVRGSANEFRIWDEDDNYLPDTSEAAGEAFATHINDTMHSKIPDRLREVNAELAEALGSCLSDLHAANPRCVRIAAYRAALARARGE